MRALSVLVISVLSLTLAACEGSDGDGAANGPRNAYPTANIGVGEGQVLANHEFLRPDGSSMTLDEVFFDSSNRLMLLVTSAGWCVACIEEQPKLEALHQEFADQGLYVLLAVFEDDQFNPAGAGDAEDWQTLHELTFTVVADELFVLEDYYDSAQTPMTMLVEVGTMEILSIATGFDEGAVRAIINAKL